MERSDMKVPKHLCNSTSNEADFSVFNLRTTRCMKYISQKKGRENDFVSELLLSGIKSTCLARLETLRLSKAPLLLQGPPLSLLKCTPLGCCGNDYGTATTTRRFYNLRSGITSRTEMRSYRTAILLCANLNREGTRNAGNL